MARRIGLTMRVVDAVGYSEPRDAIAQEWHAFMALVLPEAQWLPIPNLGDAVTDFLRDWDIDRVILTGGNDIGDNPLRDLTETAILDYAIAKNLPVLGVCRGLQMIQTYFGGRLTNCDRSRHVASHHDVHFTDIPGLGMTLRQESLVNSYHGQAVLRSELSQALSAFAFTNDDLVEGIYHPEASILAVQWHPERFTTMPDEQDRQLVRRSLAFS